MCFTGEPSTVLGFSEIFSALCRFGVAYIINMRSEVSLHVCVCSMLLGISTVACPPRMLNPCALASDVDVPLAMDMFRFEEVRTKTNGVGGKSTEGVPDATLNQRFRITWSITWSSV